MSTRLGSTGLALPKGITPAGGGKAGQAQEVVWSILGHTYCVQANATADRNGASGWWTEIQTADAMFTEAVGTHAHLD